MAGQSVAHEGWVAGSRFLSKWVLVSLTETIGGLLFVPVAVFCMVRNVFRMNLEDWPGEG